MVDVTEYAREFGFKYPVAVTSNVWDTAIDWDNCIEPTYQDESGRLYDLLWMAALSAKRTKSSQSMFEVDRIPKGRSEPSTVKLKSVCSPGDTAEPVITIMLPWED